MSSQLPAPRDPYQPPASPALEAAASAAGALSRKRKLLALVIAAVSDSISVVAEFAPPVQWLLDGVTAAALFSVMGFRWPLLPVLLVEAVPGLAAFPSWLLVVSILAGTTPTK